MWLKRQSPDYSHFSLLPDTGSDPEVGFLLFVSATIRDVDELCLEFCSDKLKMFAWDNEDV